MCVSDFIFYFKFFEIVVYLGDTMEAAVLVLNKY